jgi:hypothetical protein
LHEALGIVYFHDWLPKECDESFDTHLNIMKVFFYTPKKVGVAKHVDIEVLCAFTVDVQKSVFKITMKSNVEIALGPSNTINPLTKM